MPRGRPPGKPLTDTQPTMPQSYTSRVMLHARQPVSLTRHNTPHSIRPPVPLEKGSRVTMNTRHIPPETPMKKRLIVAITGATGSIYGMRILQQLRAIGGWESHLIVSDAGGLNAWQEYGPTRKDLNQLAHVVHNARDVGAAIASGSFITEGMVVAPCSMKTLAGIAHAFSDNLITRAADVILKERRRLVLLTREAPLNLAHLRNMLAVTDDNTARGRGTPPPRAKGPANPRS